MGGGVVVECKYVGKCDEEMKRWLRRVTLELEWRWCCGGGGGSGSTIVLFIAAVESHFIRHQHSGHNLPTTTGRHIIKPPTPPEPSPSTVVYMVKRLWRRGDLTNGVSGFESFGKGFQATMFTAHPLILQRYANCNADIGTTKFYFGSAIKFASNKALWKLLWVNPVASPNLSKSTADVFSFKRHPLEFIQHRVSVVASDLLSQETADHLLYPNPGSLMVHKQYLQYFHFHGTVLAKVQSGIAPSI
ncbi:hypothetical protein RHMOL_Rhmol05G0024800 [Rhododendron molle]|uniref:Uncharacterized protein n=1 Tax=Rhododendron molle TaxID=49168 RepID=A0ACC0NJL7_RHOML|nr:hypothetical protein RHMOL_Rhmol05G0024800 [Rhododendron molle]